MSEFFLKIKETKNIDHDLQGFNIGRCLLQCGYTVVLPSIHNFNTWLGCKNYRKKEVFFHLIKDACYV